MGLSIRNHISASLSKWTCRKVDKRDIIFPKNISTKAARLVQENRIFDAFPNGGRKGFEKEIAAGFHLATSDSDPFSFTTIQNMLKQRRLSKDRILTWRKNLQGYSDFENNWELSQAIGMLTLASGEIRHICLYPDGNRRYGREHGIPNTDYHFSAFAKVGPVLTTECFRYGVHTWSIWLTRRDNFDRSKDEVLGSLIPASRRCLKMYEDIADEWGIRIFRIGDRESPHSDSVIKTEWVKLLNEFDRVEHATKKHSKQHVILCSNYDREGDMLRTMQKIQECGVDWNQLKTSEVLKYSDFGDQPYRAPNFIIRSAMAKSGGRVTNFLLDTDGTTTYYTDRCAPELNMTHIFEACALFAHPALKYRSFLMNELYTSSSPSAMSNHATN